MVEFVKGVPYETLRRRELDSIDRVVVHRIEVSQEDPSYADSALEVARFFLEHPIGVKATGGAMPYPLLISVDGQIEQTVPLNCITPHARAANETGIGVGCVGDFRGTAPAAAQYSALVELCAALCKALDLPAAAVMGHDEISGSSHDSDKQCPGPALSMDELRSRVASRIEAAQTYPLVWSEHEAPR
ncbi:MAG: peptidoglycan recognition family protein [Myxococcota bacterium]